ncbi:hypothetical protein B0T11DRAFT_276017 [Plectosphaerella cucumerina]|uniref:Uncharacterized protein n=1 Tax=Plectosphaerella cucumerina TaxID=40658 RepID=A0A8K0TQU8_9PEZI|nr:hypothetical protein B0T11DRAFT_276017 [Plectosphaerella cucumerina]
MVLASKAAEAARSSREQAEPDALPTYEAHSTSPGAPAASTEPVSTMTAATSPSPASVPEASRVPDALPAYEPESPESSYSHPSTSSAAASAATGLTTPGSPGAQGPSVDHPFNFPSSAPLPPYTPRPDDGSTRPTIAIPQVKSDVPSPFLQAYPPMLQSFGITPETWLAFLDTLSAFLMAKVSDRALAHVADIGRHVGAGPRTRAIRVASHVKDVGKGIGSNAKRGNVIGAVMGVVGGAISIPVSAAVQTVDAILSMPFSAASAAVKTPKTPRERADGYLAVANKDWFGARGIRARIVDSRELVDLVKAPVVELLSSDISQKATTAEEQLRTLEGRIAELEVWGTSQAMRLDVSDASLWVILTEVERETAGGQDANGTLVSM